VLAARAAHDMARADLVRSWSELLEADESLRPHAASLEYYISVAKSPLNASDALTALVERHENLGRPLPTATIIFEEANPSDEAQARMLLDVADELKAHIRLAPGMAVHLGMGLATLGQWGALLELCEEAEREFDGNPRLVAFKGLALDRLGNTEAARQVLKNMLEGGLADSLALRTYVNIMVRCGFLDEALVATEKILDASSSVAQKRECVRLLFNLLQTTNPQEPRLVDLAIRFGELADPTVEVEEGVFLTMVSVGTSMSNGVVSVEKKKEIEERAEAFFERFPNSNVLRRIEASDASGDELLQRLKNMIGHTEERQQLQSRLEREMRDGKFPVPFAWRPKLAFLNIRDQLHLWEVSKRASPDDKQFHLIMETAHWTPKRAADLRGKIPLVDLTTLFLLLDLGLLDALFAQFHTVAIAQGTLAELSTLCQLFSGCSWRDKCLDLQGRLRQKLSRIVQPIAQSPDEEQVEEEDGIPVSAAEIQILCTTGGYLLYSDDLFFRQ
jgi:tetratricopeptide (TPR) repeat protein